MNRYMKILFLLLPLFCACFMVQAQEELIKEAETAYTQENYPEAIQKYESILDNYGQSSQIYYNLGNAYYKSGMLASAILNYERALLFDPGDSDIRFNLQLAKERTIDKIEPIGDFFLKEWFTTIQNMGSTDVWAQLGVFSFILFIGCLLLFFFSRWIRLKKIGFYLGLVFLVIVIFSNIFARNQKKNLVNRSAAIVFSPTVTVKSSPDTSGTDLFILHEGTKVSVKSKVGEWNEIELEDGNIGWMPMKDLEII